MCLINKHVYQWQTLLGFNLTLERWLLKQSANNLKRARPFEVVKRIRQIHQPSGFVVAKHSGIIKDRWRGRLKQICTLPSALKLSKVQASKEAMSTIRNGDYN